jgi:mono/diheme cytochrome c family protein
MIAALALCALAAPGARAQSNAFPFGDAKAGKQIYEAKCAACHAARFGGDGSRVFTRPDHHIHTAAALLAQVQACNQGAHAGLSAVDEQSVAAWLDQAYYKLEK